MSTYKLGYFCASNSWRGLEMNQLRNAIWMKERGHEVLILGLKGSRLIQEAENSGVNVAFVQKHKKYYDFKKYPPIF